MIRLFTSFYNEPNELRRSELIECLKRNSEKIIIDEVIVLLEYDGGGKEELPIIEDNVRYVGINNRSTFNDFFTKVNIVAGEEDISIIANSDVFFDKTLELVKGMKDNDCYALSRWEYIDESAEPKFVQTFGDSQDIWCFKGKIKEIEYCDFILGNYGSDNRIAYEIKKAGYNITNPSLSIKGLHLHNSNIRNYGDVRTPQNTVPPPYHIIRPTKLSYNNGNKFNMIHIGLSAGQEPKNGLQVAFETYFNYREINTAHPNLNQTVLFMAEQFKPDVVFMQIQKAEVVAEATVIALKKMCKFVVNYSGDVRSPVPQWYFDIGKHIDLTLFTNYTDVYIMREHGCNSDFLELGIDKEIFKPEGQYIKSKDVLFLANSYGPTTFPLSVERIQVVNYLKKAMPDKFALYGVGWGNLADGNLNHSQYIEAQYYRGAKIALNISHFNYDRYSSDRLMRIMGSGTFCLCKRFINCEMRFEDGVHLRYFDTLEELEQLINYYLEPENDEERNRIAKGGCDLVHSTYTFDNLAKNVLGMYNESLKPKPKLKVSAYVILHYGKQFLKEAIQAVAPSVDSIYIFYTKKPSHGHSTDAICPDTEEELKDIALSASDKCVWIPGEWAHEGQHRGEIYKYAPDASVIVNFDADEIMDMRDLQKSIEYVANGDKRNYGVNGYVNFWHTLDWEVKDFYRPIRFINTNNEWGTQGEVMQRVYHFGYAQDLSTIIYKLSCHGHSDEIPKNWLEEKYLAWTPENDIKQLHPASSQVWGEAIPFDKTTLPDYIKGHSFYTKTMGNIKGVCCCVELRKIDNFRAIVENHKYYSGFSPIIFHGTDNSEYVKEELKGLGCTYINIGKKNITEHDYNYLLTDKYFWHRIPSERILIFQHDSWLLRHGIDEFMEDGADWYGAPWAWQSTGGNGGLSLRTRSAMLKVIEKVTYNPSTMGNEDVFFSNHIELVGGILGTREMCSKFSCEAIFQLGTFGYHDIEQWLTTEQCDRIKNQYMVAWAK